MFIDFPWAESKVLDVALETAMILAWRVPASFLESLLPDLEPLIGKEVVMSTIC